MGIGSDRERYSAHCGEGRVDRRDMLLLSLTRTQRKRRRVVASARKREKAASGTSRLSLSSPRPPEERYRRRGVGISYQRLVVRLGCASVLLVSFDGRVDGLERRVPRLQYRGR